MGMMITNRAMTSASIGEENAYNPHIVFAEIERRLKDFAKQHGREDGFDTWVQGFVKHIDGAIQVHYPGSDVLAHKTLDAITYELFRDLLAIADRYDLDEIILEVRESTLHPGHYYTDINIPCRFRCGFGKPVMEELEEEAYR